MRDYSNGDYIDEWKSPNLDSETYGLTTGDVDNDGTIEIIVGTYDYWLYIFGYNGDEDDYTLEWSHEMIENRLYGLATGDTDNDGTSEIIVGTSATDNSIANVYVFGYDGSTYQQEWAGLIGEYTDSDAHIIIVGDVDDDNVNEFIVGLREIILGSYRGSFYIFGYFNGIYTMEWTDEDPLNEVRDIDIGDIDDDGNLEILVAATNVTIYQHQLGAYIVEDTIEEPNAIVEVGDVNQDNIDEFITGINEVKIWQENVLLWESTNFTPEDIRGIAIYDTDNDLVNEIIIAIGNVSSTTDVLVFGYDVSSYQEEWRGDYLDSVSVVSVNDVDGDNNKEILLGMANDEVVVYEFRNGDYIIEDTIPIPNSANLINLVSDDFDNDGLVEIAVISIINTMPFTNELYIIEFINGDYIISDQLVIDNGFIITMDVGDVDNDDVKELVVGTWTGYIKVIGFDGNNYVVEWEDQIFNNLVFAIGVGNTDDDQVIEIVVGGLLGETDDNLFILGYGAGDYNIEWSTYISNGVTAADVGDTDNDGSNEIVIVQSLADVLVIYEWDGSTYNEEWSHEVVDFIWDPCLDINHIEPDDTNKIIMGTDDLLIWHYEGDYTQLWQTENISSGINHIFVGDTNNMDDNEVVLSLGGYILIYGTEQQPFASLNISQPLADMGEEIIFDGSSSVGCSEYHFDFGDGVVTGWVSESNVTHSYSSPGEYTAFLVVRNDAQIVSSNTAEAIITVLVPNLVPTAVIDDITPNHVEEGTQITFTGHGDDEDGTIESYHWESDIDGYLSSLSSFVRSTMSVGTHIISFKVMDDEEVWSDIVTDDLIIDPKPQVENLKPEAYIDSITPNPAVEREIVTFEGHGVDTDGTITDYSWESDINGILNHESIFTSEGLAVGTHTISFKVKDNSGSWSGEVSVTLIINPIPDNQPPTVEIESVLPNPVKEGETVVFMGSAHDIDGTIVTYSWESSIDGLLSTDISFSTSSLSVGEHTISFKGKDEIGDWSESVTITLVVQEKVEEEGSGWLGGNEDEDNRLLAVIIGTLALIMAIVIATVFSLKRKKSDQGAVQMGCPSCGFLYTVTTPQRPVSVQCPNCSSIATINES
jgi:PKD repeat protein